MSSTRGLKLSARILEKYMESEAAKVAVAANGTEDVVAREESAMCATNPDSASGMGLDTPRQNPKFYNCSYCKKEFGTLMYLEHHLNGKLHPKKFAEMSAVIEDQIEGDEGFITIIPCLKCPSTHDNYEELEVHVTSVHVNSLIREEIFSCPDCGKCFSVKENMEDHVKKFHDRKYCEYCNLTFSRWMHHLATPAHQNNMNRVRGN
ncbi:unnamed protein product [Orchesella dallaii]|uniref:C2H2-type domain-containing protein n=1 Tax=Orchesella dallaii TaxID=48710 RepID=A0ABP1Q119_9HEXA